MFTVFSDFLVKIQVFPPKKAISDRTIILDFLYVIVLCLSVIKQFLSFTNCSHINFLKNVYSFQRFLVKIQVSVPKKAISDRTIFLDFLYMIVLCLSVTKQLILILLQFV